MPYFPDLGKPGVVGVPNPILRETGPELFKTHKVGTVPVKTGRTATSYRHPAVIARSNVISADGEGSQTQGLRQKIRARNAQLHSVLFSLAVVALQYG